MDQCVSDLLPHARSHAPVTRGQVWRELISWSLLWPLLNLTAGQAPFLSGPARSTNQIKYGAAGGVSADQHLALYLLLAFQLVFVLLAAKSICRLLLRNPLLIACLALPLASSFWSGNVGNTLHKTLEADASLLFSAYLYTRFSVARLQRLLMFLGIVSALLSTFAAIAMPSYGIFAEYAGGAWQGICNHKNTLGYGMAFLLTPVFFVPDLTRARRTTYALFLLFLIGMSQSRGAWIDSAALIAFIGLMWLLRRLSAAQSWLAVVVAVAVTAVAMTTGIALFDTIAPLLGKDATMSGRSEIYRLCWQAFCKRPVLGYGYGGFWATAPEALQIGLNIGWTNIGYAESGLLEVGLQLGLVGVALVVWLLARAVLQGMRLALSGASWTRANWFLSILVLALLTNIDGGMLLVQGTLDWTLIVIACIGLNEEARRVTSEVDYRSPKWAGTRPLTFVSLP